MASAIQQYTLVDFTEELDWKPLHFVKPLPRNRLCSVCGLVRKTTAHLPCGHIACHFCYNQCRTAEGYNCPIDAENGTDEEVDWRDFPAEKLLTRQVKCWNQEHGCPLVMAATEVHKHFHRECEYHSTTCPRCSTMVLCRDMGEHVGASCCASTAPQTVECEEMLTDAVERRISTIVRTVVQEQAGEMKALLERALRDNGALNDSLCEVTQSVNCLKESVSQSTAPVGEISEMTHRVLNGINELHRAVNSEMADIKEQNAEVLPEVRAAIESAKEDAGASTKTMLEMQKKALAFAEELPRVRAAIESAKEDAGASTKTMLEMQKKALAFAEELPRVRAAIESAKEDAGASTKTMLEMQKKALAFAEELPRVRAAIESAKEDAGASTKTMLEMQKKALAFAEELPRVRAAIESAKEDAGASTKTMLEMQKKALAFAEELPRVLAAIESAKEDAGASTKMMLEMQNKALGYAEKDKARCDIFVPGIASLEAKALKDGHCVYYHEQVYLRGYNISPGAQLTRKEECLFLDVLFQLHRGEHDDVIQWPFEHEIRFTILHPAKKEEKAFVGKTTRSHKNYKKPENSSNAGMYFNYCFKYEEVKSAGYVCDDSLRVRFEIL
ncbi:hypothetical protein MTO96_034473 [Rhipicephalus appendiculatus]